MGTGEVCTIVGTDNLYSSCRGRSLLIRESEDKVVPLVAKDVAIAANCSKLDGPDRGTEMSLHSITGILL